MVERFEDLRCWQQSRELLTTIYELSSDGSLSRDFAVRDQLRRASLSVMNNIAEGFGRLGSKEKVYFFNVSQSSALEVKSMTYVLEDLKYLEITECEHLREKSQEIRNSVLALIKSQK